ncbi:MAG: ABC transporter permease [Candidatus Heritagella sp.]
MRAVLKREIRSYFTSPIGYVCIAVLLALFGYWYYIVMLSGSSSNITYVYSYMFSYCMMIIPILTMRTISDDQKNKTDQALLTAPVSVMGIVIGKFLAAFFVYFVALTGTLVPCVVISFFGAPNWSEILGNYVGSLLYGGAMISIGVFISSLTVSQIIAAIGTFAVSILLVIIGQISSSFSGTWIADVVKWISFESRYSPFTQGQFNLSSVVYFISVMAIFVFFTTRKIESRRYR